LIGVVLNKADIAKLRTYDDSLSVLYDEARYSTYLKDDKARRGRWFKKGAQQKGIRAKQVVQQ
jgi:hypothetical protein